MCPADRPTPEDLDRLLDRLGPEIARVLERWRIPESEAAEVVGEALVGIAYRWDRIRDRERWVLQAIEKEAQSRSTAFPEEEKK